MPGDDSEIRKSLERSIAEHNPRLDSFLYNGGTALAIICTTAATSFVWTGETGWIPRVLTGIATVVIALERALGFGARWQSHRRMRAQYEGLLQDLDLLPDDGPERAAELRAIRDAYKAARHEDVIPAGAGPEGQ
jgi:hypothetical protein